MNQLIDRWLEVLDVEVSTRQGYVKKIEKHIRPLMGKTAASRIGVLELEAFYAALRRCRDHCGGRRYIVHRKAGEHACTAVCRPHQCKGLADSTIRQIHWIISGAMSAGVRWGWIGVNPADNAKKPAVPRSDPKPPSAPDAARLVNAAWEADLDWGAFVWTAMTTGARRAELCALHLCDMDLDAGVLTLSRALYVDDDGVLQEKDTKAHQQRRVALDAETVEVLRDVVSRHKVDAAAVDHELSLDGYVFSPYPDGLRPLVPDTATQRFERMVARLGIGATLHSLRHYSATDLITADVDIRTVAGRLGHGGGGATTVRVYAAWSSEADQRAASTMSGRMPPGPAKARTREWGCAGGPDSPGTACRIVPYLRRWQRFR